MSQFALIDIAPSVKPKHELDVEDDLDERYTLLKDFLPIRDEFGLTFDICATAESAKLPRFWTKRDDALKQDWRGLRGWANIPFSNIAPWIVKARETMLDPTTPVSTVIAMLVPTWSDRRWWQELIEPDRDLNGKRLLRTRFLPRWQFGKPGDPLGLTTGDSASFWPVLFIWRPKPRRRSA
jgi:hypothetical protein